MTLFDRLVRLGMPLIPKLIVAKVAGRYVAGDTIGAAVQTMRSLGEEGAVTTVDVLGEEVRERSRAEAAVSEYLQLLETISSEGLERNISVKPTMLGLKIDEGFCSQRIAEIVRRAHELGAFVRIDMEDHTCTDATLRIYRQMQAQYGNVGVVLQAYLHRTIPDISALLPLKPNIRICKGIYREPRDIAWKDFDTVRANFISAMERLLEGGAHVGIATHDRHLVCAGLAAVDRLGLPPDRYEFQMLLGVDAELRRVILGLGHRLRVYVPYGRDWYPYSMRRLRENPTIARHVMRAMIGLS
jgi:proline dehydrogenase